MLEIILRTCTNSSITQGWKRFIDVEKKELVRRCVGSLIKSINNSNYSDIKLTVIDHNSQDLDLVQSLLDQCLCKYQLINFTEPGFNASAHYQFLLCRDSTADMVYSVEDDYLHEIHAIDILCNDYNYFSQMTRRLIAMHPADDPFSYLHSDKMYSAKIVAGSDRYWRTNKNSTHTLFSSPQLFKMFWNKFEKLSLNYSVDNTTEHNTINLIWDNGVDAAGEVLLFTPMPGLASHISYNNKPLFYNIDKVWEENQ